MTKEIPQFLTCPICKRAKVVTRVKYKASLNGKDVLICGTCAHKHGLSRREVLVEPVAEFSTNVEEDYG